MSIALHDAAWYESMYNNRALVPDCGEYLQRWADDSAVVRRGQAGVLDLAYGPAASETLDIFPARGPQSNAGAPVLVFVHGGYWSALDKSDHSFVAPAFCQQGCCVVVVNYALCPGTASQPVSIPMILEQMERALAWVGENIARHGGDPARITVAGHSAGGQIAAMLLCTAGRDESSQSPVPRLRNALSISGVHDLEPLMHTPRYQSVLRLTPGQIQQASPARQPVPAQGELWCAAGGDESAEFLRQNQLMQAAWGTAIVPQTAALPGLHHFSILDTLATPGQALHDMALGLLRAPRVTSADARPHCLRQGSRS
ncbi:alpha/beta hydrolase [Simplicispira suum]|uniref:alpha/beta hydrolase n=1 Tax=Simplicispira suum TaxID=2109915 RepID=UPI0014761E7F|nr:alpha/beta hydrolase [Simplicispira suum]